MGKPSYHFASNLLGLISLNFGWILKACSTLCKGAQSLFTHLVAAQFACIATLGMQSNVASLVATVKNGLSDPTKVQNGWDRYRNNIGHDHQGKDLKELS